MENSRSQLIHEGERLDDLERDGLMIIQDPGTFCFGVDAVLLSSFAVIKPGDVVLDIGTGNGIIPLLLSAKTKAKDLFGIEIQPAVADMASRSVAYNGLEDRVHIVCGDINESEKIWKPETFDAVICNPPYMSDEHGLKNPEPALAIARHEIKCTLEDVIREGARLLKTGGRYCMIHRPHRLVDVITVMRKYRLEPKRLRMIHPYKDKEATMFLVEAVSGGGVYMHVEEPLIIYESKGEYTEEIRRRYGK